MSIASQSLPPFSRDQPAPIAVSRFDGRRIVDGAGLSSVGINFPQRIQYDDPLADLRSSLLTIVRNKHLDAAVRCLREDAIPAPIIAQVESNFVAALPDVEQAFRSFFTQHFLSADFVPETFVVSRRLFDVRSFQLSLRSQTILTPLHGLKSALLALPSVLKG